MPSVEVDVGSGAGAAARADAESEETQMADSRLAQKSLALDWVFGVGDKVDSLQTETCDAVVYTAEHTCVIYSPSSGKMRMLQAHCNAITALATTADKSVVATADAGPGSFIVLWDTDSATPLRSISPPRHSGVLAMDFSPDGTLLATVRCAPFAHLVSFVPGRGGGGRPAEQD